MALLEVKGLTKQFGTTAVLCGIDFSMKKGEVVAIIGSSGGGKTTFLRCLNFLEQADAGIIRIGNDCEFDATGKYTEKAIRDMRLHFGLVFQSFNLFPQYSALKNVLLPLELRTAESIRRAHPFGSARQAALTAAHRENTERARQLLSDVGLADKMENYPCELSGGQCQRVAIARALALNPDILCFDEPTSALDPELTGEVLRVIRSLKDNSRTMIIVTHEMEFARNVADRIVFMANGVIEEEGTPEEIFNRPKSPLIRAFLSKTTGDMTGDTSAR